MITTVIGANGAVGSSLVEHMSHFGHQTIVVDRETTRTIENSVPESDVIFVATLPLDEVPDLINQVASLAKTGSLIVNGSSIEQPRSSHKINHSLLTSKRITLCHCHFHFRPEIPLRRTLAGQSISVSFVNDVHNKWRKWVRAQFLEFAPQWHSLEEGEHDDLTVISQLTHMITCFIVGNLWTKADSRLVKIGTAIGGPPFRLLLRSLLRTASAASVTSNILLSHPKTVELIDKVISSLTLLKQLIDEGNKDALTQEISSLRSLVETESLNEWDRSTNELIRLDADMSTCTIVFHFKPNKNLTGLLAKVLHEFDIRNIEKTTTVAQVNPDGGCTFRIGVRHIDSRVDDAVQEVNSW